jgi:membrane associated rhomboid family serine protease
MGFQDRHYNRNDRDGFASLSRWSVNTWLIVVNVAVFITMALFPTFQNAAYQHGHFSTWHVLYHEVNNKAGGLEFWRFLTFQFLHAPGLMHIGMNMLGLFIFGGIVESQLGAKKYLAFYLVCGIFGGLLYLLLNLGGYFFPQVPMVLINDVRTPLVGASAGVFGVILACAKIAPDMQVQLLFPPIPMRMRTMAYVYVGIAVATLLMRGSNAGGEAAHLGGAAAGAFFIRNSHLLRDFFDVFRDSRKTPPRTGRPRRAERGIPPPDLSHDQEVDRILAKVKDRGVQSLTDREKRVLARDTEEKRARG